MSTNGRPEPSTAVHENMTGVPPPDSHQPHGPQLNCSAFVQTEYIHDPYLTASAFMLGISMMVLNGMVIVFMAWSMSRSKKLNIPKVLVVALAVTDFSFGLFDIITQSFRYWFGYCGTGGAPVCTTQAFFSNVFTICSMVVVLVMSVERFCALRLPFHYDRYFTTRNTAYILLGLVLYAVVAAGLPLVGLNHYSFGGFGCDFDWRDTSPGGSFYVYFRGLQGLFLMPIIMGLNLTVLAEVNRMSRVVPAAPNAPGADAGGGGGGESGASNTLQKRFAVLTILASLAFIVCNSPWLIRLIQYQLKITNAPMPDYFVKRMFFSNSLINPCLSLFFYLSNIQWGQVCRCLSPTDK